MILYWLVFVLFAIYSSKKTEKAFAVFAAWQIIIHSGTCLVQSPTLSLKTALSLWFLFLYCIKFRDQRLSEIRYHKYPYILYGNLYILSLVLVCVFSTNSINNYIFSLVQEILNNVLLAYLFWRYMHKKEYMLLFIKHLCVALIVVTTYAVFESASHLNPIIDFEMAFGGEGKMWKSTEIRYGLLRCQSFMPIHLVFGGYCAFISSFILYIKQYHPTYLPFINKQKVIIFMGVLGVVLANSKSSTICLIALMLPLFLKKKYFNSISKIIIVVLLLFVISLIAVPFVHSMNAAFDQAEASESGGSSFFMRISQLDIILENMAPYDMWGHGLKTIEELAISRPDLLGAESVWFVLLYERGIWGSVGYIIFVLGMVIVNRYYHVRYAYVAPVAWLVFSTLTSTPSMDYSFVLILCLATMKINISGNSKDVRFAY